ncbi:hypothetical protein JVU11DRAFT_9678 [Chiua virens]|nr:hypothetical protein JVU11DRAFT_9678 [Chiua virens]
MGSVGPIPDCTIGALIDNIVKEKGDNITVIFDCCYLAGCARHSNQDYVPQTVELDFNIPADFDKDIWGLESWDGILPNGFTHQGHRSHVLFAACGEKELAYEHNGCSLFTSALLKTLQSGEVNDLSYVQVLGCIHIDKQNPQCLVNEQGNLLISAGLAHGMSYGVEFSLYNDQKLRTLCRMDGSGTSAPNFLVVEKAQEARLQIAMEGDLVVFNILDRQVNKFGLGKLPYTVSLHHLSHVLHAAAHYYWYLALTNRHGHSKPAVAVDFYMLKDLLDYDDYGRNNPHLIDFTVTPGAHYGIKIMNNVPRDLYVNVFLFNNSSLSITPCYTQSSAGNPEPLLKQKGRTFAIGYGPEETMSLNFTLRDGQDINVGYLKFFFTTQPIDFSDIELMSPFLEKKFQPSGSNMDPCNGHLANNTSLRQVQKDIWFTVTIPVMQQRKA